jgi:hypothetical protein
VFLVHIGHPSVITHYQTIIFSNQHYSQSLQDHIFNPKTVYQTPKSSASSIPLARLEYDFLEDPKKTKANISLFELMKIPQIQEIFIKTLQGKNCIGKKETKARTKKGTTKEISSNNNTPSKSQIATNVSLIRQRSISTTSPFLVTFEIFDRNVHSCMVDS